MPDISQWPFPNENHLHLISINDRISDSSRLFYSWCSLLLQLLAINPRRALSSRRLPQSAATLRPQLDIDAAAPNVHSPLVGRLQVRGGTTHRLIWQWQIRFHAVDLVLFRFLFG